VQSKLIATKTRFLFDAYYEEEYRGRGDVVWLLGWKRTGGKTAHGRQNKRRVFLCVVAHWHSSHDFAYRPTLLM
jgi:hypothetical protein